jgi:hypothetical protein
MHNLASSHSFARALAEFAGQSRFLATLSEISLAGVPEVARNFRDIAASLDECARLMDSPP